MEEGFENAADLRWVCHPEILPTQAAARHPFAPSINFKFMDGIVCPPDSIPLDEVISFRNRRSAEREAFFDALYRASDTIEVDSKKLSVNVPVDRINSSIESLNRTLLERWAGAVRRSFEFDIRPNAAALVSLAGALASYTNVANFGSEVMTTLFGTLACSLSLTPRLEKDDGFTRAMAFVLNAKIDLERGGREPQAR
jgi:hypothetical protein